MANVSIIAGPLICEGTAAATSYTVKHPDIVIYLINGYFKQTPNVKNRAELIGNSVRRIMDSF